MIHEWDRWLRQPFVAGLVVIALVLLFHFLVPT